MSFKDCIDTAVTSGRISKKKGDEGKAAYDEAFATAKAAGKTDGPANLDAQRESVAAISSIAKAKRWSRISEMQKAHKLSERILNSDNPSREVDEITRHLDFAQKRIAGQAMSNLSAMILKYEPKVGGLVRPIASADEIVYAAHGDPASAEAKLMAKAVQESDEFLRTRANEEGASIPKNENYRMGQTQERLKVRQATPEEFVKDHLENDDWEVMQYAGKLVPENQREAVLLKVRDRILTDGNIDLLPGQHNQGGLANRLARDRFFYYKNGASWLKMQKKYGSGNVLEQIYGRIDQGARDIATLEILGPNPNTMLSFITDTVKKRAGQLDLNLSPKEKSWTTRAEEAVDRLEKGYMIFSQHVLNGDESRAVQVIGSVRTLTTMNVLGFSFLTNLGGDLALSKWAAQFHGMPETGIIRSYLDKFVNKEISAEQVIRDAVIYESGLSIFQQQTRFFGPMDGKPWARLLSDTAYRIGMTTRHNGAVRHMAAQKIQGYWADNAGKQFEELGMMRELVNFGITKEQWDVFRTKTPLDVQGNRASFLRPMNLYRTGSASEKRVADKFLDYMVMAIHDFAPEQSIRTQIALGRDVSPKRLAGQRLRFATVLTGFPMEILFNQYRRIWEIADPKEKMKQAARLAVYLTLGGAFITQAKALANGENPNDMTTWQFWGRAALNGGTFGLLGDFFYNNVNLLQGEVFSQSSPVKEYARKLGKLGSETYKAASGDPESDADKAALDVAFASVPKIWWLRLLFARSFGDELMEQADPGAFARRQRMLQENHPEGRWSAPEGYPTEFRPQSAIGG